MKNFVTVILREKVDFLFLHYLAISRIANGRSTCSAWPGAATPSQDCRVVTLMLRIQGIQRPSCGRNRESKERGRAARPPRHPPLDRSQRSRVTSNVIS